MKKTLMLIRFDVQPRPEISRAIAPFFIEGDKPFFTATPTTMITFFHTEATRLEVYNAVMATGQLGIAGFLLVEVSLETMSMAIIPAQNGAALLEYMGGRVVSGTTTGPASSQLTPEERFNQLLDKVSAHGEESLTAAEKEELRRLSN